MNLSTIPCKISRVFLKKQDFPQKKYSLPLQGIYVSVVCSMHLTYCIPVLNAILNTTMKPPLRAKKHVSFICNFPFRMSNAYCFSNKQHSYKLWRNLLKDAALVSKKRNLLPHDMVSLQVGNIPVPYVACFSIHSHVFNMQNPMHQRNIP